MTALATDVAGIGNAIVDVLGQASDETLAKAGIAKGTMTLIDAYRAHQLAELLTAPLLQSGGSAANTIAGLAGLGARTAFIGKVKDDALGQAFAADLARLGVVFPVAPAPAGPPTAQSFIFVSPDGQRSMNTYLGASVELGEADVDPGAVASAAVLYVEGYLWDPPTAKAAIRRAIAAAKRAGRKVAFTLSDPFCVSRWRGEFRALVETDIDILFANEHEICALYEVDRFDDAFQAVRAQGLLAVLTRSDKGAVIARGNEVHLIDAAPARVVDTTGAGDLFAAGFLYGVSRACDLGTAGRMGALAAAEVISQMGPRPQRPLRPLFAAHGFP